jgi:methionyl-tRNA synthetase
VTAPDRYYITTAIPYVNSTPHIGFALEIVQADAFARYHRLRGDDTYFLTGTDENALKNVQAAEAAGVSTEQLVEAMSQRFLDLREPLGLSFDQFIRTAADRRHALEQKKSGARRNRPVISTSGTTPVSIASAANSFTMRPSWRMACARSTVSGPISSRKRITSSASRAMRSSSTR